jgi:HPt (histidine-containing phosphotransfer) domain-containing protein
VSSAGEGVDRAHLDRLAARFGAGFVAQMIDLFLTQAEELLHAAGVAARAGDVTRIMSAVHALKSSAANVGAMSLSARSAEVERLGRETSSPDLAPDVDALVQEFHRVRDGLRAVRDTHYR